MSWYDNVFLAPPEDEPEPVLDDGDYEMYLSNGEFVQVVVDGGEIEEVYRWEDDGETQVECSKELSHSDYDHIVENILDKAERRRRK